MHSQPTNLLVIFCVGCAACAGEKVARLFDYRAFVFYIVIGYASGPERRGRDIG